MCLLLFQITSCLSNGIPDKQPLPEAGDKNAGPDQVCPVRLASLGEQSGAE